MAKRFLRIHGDNIVECERTPVMIAEALKSDYHLIAGSPLYMPKYTIETEEDTFEIELLSGHGRWEGIDLGDIVHRSGGKLRESADSYITEVKQSQEVVLLGIEYCSALPAGNNAWQRNGRALASVFANVPYLFYAEIGGIELDEDRTPKTTRYPNPAVPFSFISASHDMDSICLPVYREHPSMTEENYTRYKDSLGYETGLTFLREIINGSITENTINVLSDKSLSLVKILSENRKVKDTLVGEEWNNLLNSNDRASWLAHFDRFGWKKKSSKKVKVSSTFAKLKAKVEKSNAKPITSKDLPFCIIPKEELKRLKSWLGKTYNGLDTDFSTNKNLAIVWITGFKPKGDDSRPDRGLSPLCRMILGKDANIMAVVSGPAPSSTWDLLLNDYKTLCDSNGLFQSIFTCCNYLLVDSETCEKYIFMKTGASLEKSTSSISFPYSASPEVAYSEQDTDCGIHQILSHHEDLGIYECFCNPPGGDWSGISFFGKNTQYKWTSLPRVSELSKRPDHIFQIVKGGTTYFVTVESKGLGRDLEINIGNRLKDYIDDLFKSEPTAHTTEDSGEWRYFAGSIGDVKYKSISVGAFLYKNDAELERHLKRGNLDAIFAFEFDKVSTLHFSSNNAGRFLAKYLKEIASEQKSFVVKVH